ncbi:MAG TPA: hypothetical protein VK459_22490 [Polyangiaceae bacterium]|jgi:hypothetical protein|nr:hypothetical protein [Polyangiaceae bacterium]
MKYILADTVVEAQPLDKMLGMDGMLTKEDASTGLAVLGATAVY